MSKLTESCFIRYTLNPFHELQRELVVIIYCNIFFPLLLTALSANLVLILTLSCATLPQPQLLPVNHSFLMLKHTAV